MKILDTFWFNEMGSARPIGIVVGEDDVTGERKAFIGTADGYSEPADAAHIAATGAKLRLSIVADIAARHRRKK